MFFPTRPLIFDLSGCLNELLFTIETHHTMEFLLLLLFCVNYLTFIFQFPLSYLPLSSWYLSLSSLCSASD